MKLIRSIPKFIIEALAKSYITFNSTQYAKDIYDKMQLIIDDPDHFIDSPNLSGKIDNDYNFTLTHKIELGTLSIGGFAGMNADLTGKILTEIEGSKIIITVKPNSYFPLLFYGMLISGLFIMFLMIFSLTDDANSLKTGLFALFIICPILVIRSYYAKKNLVNTFVNAFKLTKDEIR